MPMRHAPFLKMNSRIIALPGGARTASPAVINIARLPERTLK
ncbi:hypothetical protein [Kushneria phosphatilytica]|nr:hypothetical protein [Kushneria phosphatilytica]